MASLYAFPQLNADQIFKYALLNNFSVRTSANVFCVLDGVLG
jgi:hypothetical protein